MAVTKLGKVSIVSRGDWINDANYEALDLVTNKGASYLCRKTCTGVEPTTGVVTEFWQPFGTGVEIATTMQTGIVRPDADTIEIKDPVTGRIGIASEIIEQINTSSEDIELINETLGTDEELDNLPYPAKSMAGNISQLNSNLTNSLAIGTPKTVTVTCTAGAWAYANLGAKPTKTGYTLITYIFAVSGAVGLSPSYQSNSNDIWLYGRTSGTATVTCYPIFAKN